MSDTRSLITPDRLDNLRRAVQRTLSVDGDMAELGVYRGGSARVISAAAPARTLHLFDTFCGLPWNEDEIDDPHRYLEARMFYCSESEAREFLFGCPVLFHPGLFPETATGLDDLRFSFVHIDCDLYRSAKSGIDWFWSRLVSGGIMFFDDFGCDFTGVTRAVQEAFDSESIERQYDVNGFQIGCLVVKQ